MGQPSLIFNGTPYDFYGFIKGLVAEVFLGFDEYVFSHSCFAIEGKDVEENISLQPPFVPQGYQIRRQRPDQARKQTVTRDTRVTPSLNSSIVYFSFNGSNAAKLPPFTEQGWITAQKLPGGKSKLIIKIDYALPFNKNVWDNLYEKLQKEGWLGEIPQTTIASFDPLEKPDIDMGRDAFFDYYYNCKKAGKKYTLQNLADDIGVSLSHVKYLHRLYKVAHGIE